MTVTDRLRRLTGEALPAPATTTGTREKLHALRASLEALSQRQPAITAPRPSIVPGQEDLVRALGGGECDHPHGKCHLVRTSLAWRAPGGNREYPEPSPSMATLALLAGQPILESFSPEEGLFLDTETTGLAGGTGTFAFLVGLGWFEAGAFHSCQILARDFSEERALLGFLREHLDAKRFLVTYNGKSFDIPLLSSRFILNRLDDPLPGLAHLDLVHPARRLLKHRSENHRLETLEEVILGCPRQGDIPGAEIPQRYFDWLRRRDGALLRDVVAHNRQDILSLARLTVYLAAFLDHCRNDATAEPADGLSVALWLLHRRREPEARRLLEDLAVAPVPAVRHEARYHLSRLLKRNGVWEDAVRIWQETLREDPADLFALEELAKWYEHRSRDYGEALALVRRGLNGTRPCPESRRPDLIHREARLHRRLRHSDDRRRP